MKIKTKKLLFVAYSVYHVVIVALVVHGVSEFTAAFK